MKKVLKISLLSLSLCSSLVFAEDISKLDVKKECDVKANGIEKVVKTAEKYNAIAKEHKVEFMRFGMMVQK